MTDPLRRDPAEFLRVLKKMAYSTSWQKAMIFASKGRMVGYRLTLDHYNTVLFSQAMWGRALEIIKTVRALQEDNIQPNGATYYYICHGMGNAEHGWNFDFPVNRKLPQLQHWRVAIEALSAAELNGFDVADTSVNSCMVACTIPSINRWREAVMLLHKLADENRKLHPNSVKFFHDCLVRNMRPREASALMRMAAEQRVQGYENAWEPDIYKHLPPERIPTSEKEKDTVDETIEREQKAPEPFSAGLHITERGTVFRPRVFRQQFYRFEAIAQKAAPRTSVKRSQLTMRDSPTGIPGWHRL
jgi:hypothetical protein